MVAVFVVALAVGLLQPAGRAACRPALRAAVATARVAPATTMLLPESFLLAETLESLAELGPVEPHRPFTFIFTNLLMISLAWNVFVAPFFRSNEPADETKRFLNNKGYAERVRNKKVASGDSAKTERLSSFGWLHADLRTPLPSLEELGHSCHLVGVRDGHQVPHRALGPLYRPILTHTGS